MEGGELRLLLQCPLSFCLLISLSSPVSSLNLQKGHGKGQEPFQTLSVWCFPFTLSFFSMHSVLFLLTLTGTNELLTC